MKGKDVIKKYYIERLRSRLRQDKILINAGLKKSKIVTRKVFDPHSNSFFQKTSTQTS